MNNLFEYLSWRGDIPFEAVGPVNADFAVFCSLSYIPFETIVGTRASGRFIALGDAAGKVLEKANNGKDKVVFHLPDDRELLRVIIASPRFSRIRIGYYLEIFNTDRQEQFCAMTFILPTGDMVVAFRGTDGTIIGWKEDFNMGFMDTLPSQTDAVEYLKTLAKARSGNLYLCGHSKGGNLAMYAAAFSDGAVQDRIIAIRSLDGPGFKKQVIASAGFRNVSRKIITFMPQYSIVGLILEHTEKSVTVHSFAKGLKQHDIYSWEICGSDFVKSEELSKSSVLANKAINSWITDMSDESRRKLTDGLFEIVESAQVDTLEELFEAKNLIAVRKNYGRLDSETKALLSETGRIFMNSVRRKSKKKNVRKSRQQGESKSAGSDKRGFVEE